jgi:hypothetical protein
MITKVFRIELAGGKDVEKDFISISKATVAMGKAIAKAKGELATLVSTKADPGAISSLTAKISELEAKYKSLAQERKKAEADAKTLAQTEKLLAEAKLKSAQATQVEIDTMIAQDKELDRQIDREKKETEAIRKKKKELEGLPGSYNTIKKAAQELYAELKKGNNTSTVTTASGKSFKFDEAISEYKRLSSAEQDFRRQFSKDGTLVGEYASGIVDAFKRLNIDDIIKNDVNNAKKSLGELESKTKEMVVAYRQAQQQNISSTEALKTEINQLTVAYDQAKVKGVADLAALETKMKELQVAYHQAQQSGGQDLDKLQKEIHDNVVETENLKKAVSQAEVQLKGIGGVGEQITGSINKGFKELRNSIGQFALTYLGFQAIFSGLQTGVDNAKQFSDQTTELEIQLNKAKGGADGLVDSLSQLNTRTKLTTLEDIANIALKAGATEQNLLGVTKAIDTVKTAFGKDFGDIETGTETFVKLINIFYDDGQVTEDRILKIGNSVRTLANETVASVPFINDFAGRMAGVRQVANVTLPQIVGLGAGFEEFKQSAEVSSTVLVKVIPQLARDIDTFANIAGTTREEFKKLLQENPIEALLQVSQGLVKGKGDIEVFSNTLQEAGIDAGRAVSIISTLGGKAEIFRDRISRAGVAIQSTDAITDAFTRKNENLAATLDKIGKKFADAASGKAFQTTLIVIGTAITFLLANIPALLILGGLLVANWAAQNAQLLLLRAQVLGYNIVIGASYVAMGALTIAQTAYNAITFITSTALALATRALAFFGITVRATAGPLGIILTIATLLTAAFVAFGRKLEAAQGSLSEFVRLQKINAEISREASKATSEQISTLDGWIAVIKSAATSADTKRKAMDKLIEINPAFRDALKGQTIDLNELDKAYGKVVQGIQAKARAEAAATLSAGKQKKVTEISGLRQDLEIQVAQKSKPNQSEIKVELSEDQKEILKKGDFLNSGAVIYFSDEGAVLLKHRFDQIKTFLDKKEKEAIGVYQDYLKAQALAEENLTKVEEQVQKKSAIDTSETVFQIFERLFNNNGTGADFKALLKKIQEQKKSTDVLSKEYKDLLALEAKVKDLLKPKAGSSGGGNRSPEKQKLDDRLKEIEAGIIERKNALDSQLAEGLISERDYYAQVRDNTTNGEQDKINIILEFQQRYKKALARFHGDLAKDVSEAERKQLAAKRDANQKLFDLDNKQLEINLRNEQSATGRDRDATLLNPNLSNEERLQATIDYYDRLLVAQVVFNQKQIEAEKKYGVKSVENAQKRKEEIERIRKELEQSEADRPEARQRDIQAAADRQLAEIRRRVAQQTVAILESNSSYTKKARELAKLEVQATKDQLAEEAAAAKLAFEQAEKDREKGLISEKEYLDKLEEYKTKEAALYKYTTDEQVSATQRFVKALKELKDTFLETILGIKTYTKDAAGEQERIQDAIKGTAETIKSTINEAYQAYFQNQEQRIESDKQDQIETLDREKQRVLARATGEAEKETIERQFAQKQKAVEKKAAEEKRQLALKQATIDFAVAVMKTFAQFGFPLGLIPVAALTAAYFLQRAQISKQQFAFGGALKKKEYGLGGKAGEVPVNGGVFGGKTHGQGGTDFEFGGQAYNAEVDEMNIIRTRNAPKTGTYSITGSHKQIASALNAIGGGISFATGASVKKFTTGGYLGSKLKAPYFSAGAYLNGGSVSGKVNDDRIERLEAMTEQVLAAVYSTDAKPVTLVAQNVTSAQRKKEKDVSTGTL